MASTPPVQHSFEVTNLPTTAVTVYADRAEVKRALKAEVQLGANEVVVKKLTNSIDKESIRVEGRGKATIVEVQYQEKHVKKEDELQEEQKQLSQKLDKLREDRQKLRQEEQRYRKQRELLDGLVDKIGKGPAPVQPCQPNQPNSSPFFEISKTHLDGLDSFSDYYVERAAKLDEKLMDVEKKGRDMDEEIRVVENNLNRSRMSGGGGTALSREVSILLDAEEAGSIELDISYIVWNASWKPSYDLRVYTTDRDLKVFYYGLVQQNTGEPWNDVKLALSTATPSIGGQIPELSTMKVGFHKPPPPPPPPPPPAAAMVMHRAEPQCVRTVTSVPAAGQPVMLASMQTATLNVLESVISTSFEIARPTTIPSDNASHKVTVALIDLKPNFEYETVPKKSPLAYLKARVKNASQYPLLTGPTSVFLDNNFVAKSQLKAVSPQEEFTCSLGVDPAIRVEYKPARKFHEETGLLSKSSVTTLEQKISLKNTRSDSVKITVVDQLPLSSEEKLKVNLLEPQLRENAKHVRLNKQNNLEWDLQLNAGESKEVILKYQLEHPRGEQLEYKEDEL